MGEKCSWSKLTEDDVRYIRSHMEVSNIELGKLFNVSCSCISAVKNYRSWKNVS
jgi:hypothetical protein